MIKEINKKR